MKRLLPLLLLCACALSAYAGEIPVNIKAETLKFSEEKNIVTATGSVEIKFNNITILADMLEMHSAYDIITAEGNVKIKGGEYDAFGEKLVYNISNEVSTLYDFTTIQSPPTIKGKLFLSGNKITDYKNKMIGSDTGVSTCDEKKKHYLVMAKKVEYYPDDKIIGYSVTFYEGWIEKAPIMWVPYIYYDLKKHRKRNWTFGNNQVEGNFVKSVWDSPYPLDGSLIFLDWMDKKGIGYGTEFYYGEKSSAYLYHLEEKDTKTQDWVVKLKHNKKINKTTDLKLQHDSSKIYLIPSGRTDKFSNKISWDHRGTHQTKLQLEQLDDTQNNTERYLLALNHYYKGYKTAYSSTLDQRKSGIRNIRLNQRLSHSQPLLFEKTKLKTNFNYNNYIKNTGDIGDERLNVDYTISHSNNYFDLTFYEDYYFDMDGSNYTEDSNLQYLEKQPEITLTSKSLDLRLFKLRSTMQYGWYHEVKYVPALGKNRDYSANRQMGSLDANKSIPLLLGTTLGLQAAVSQYSYETGDQRYSYRESASLNTSLWERVRNGINFSRGISEGNSPFYFDTVNSNYSTLKEKLILFYKSHYNWTTTIGYNFKIKKYDNLVTSMKFVPAKKMNFTCKSGYDITNKKYLDLSAGFKLSPLSGLTLEVNANQDINIGLLKSANSLINWEIGNDNNWQNHWNLKLAYVYDTATQDFKLRDISILKDLHCWNVMYTYSDYRKEISVTFTIKALPDEPFGYAPARGFYFESFEKSMKEFKQSSPRRY